MRHLAFVLNAIWSAACFGIFAATEEPIALSCAVVAALFAFALALDARRP